MTGGRDGSPRPARGPSPPRTGREGSSRRRLRVAVTRPPGKAEELGALLEERGLEPLLAPLIRIVSPGDPGPLRDAAKRLRAGSGPWKLLLFTSANAVGALERALADAGGGSLEGPPAAAIGTATAAAVRRLGLEPEAVPDDFVAEAFLADLVRRYGTDGRLAGFRVLFPRAATAREVLPEGLRARGARVDMVEAYRTLPDAEAARALVARIEAGEVDVLTFTSASTVHAFRMGAGPGWKPPEGLAVATIGPVTADAARSAGLPVTLVTPERTASGLAAAVARWAR